LQVYNGHISIFFILFINKKNINKKNIKKMNINFSEEEHDLISFNKKLFEYYGGGDYSIVDDIYSVGEKLGRPLSGAFKGIFNLILGFDKFLREKKKIDAINQRIEDYKNDLKEFYNLKQKALKTFDDFLKNINDYKNKKDLSEITFEESFVKELENKISELEDIKDDIFDVLKKIDHYNNNVFKKYKEEYEKKYSRDDNNKIIERLKDKVNDTFYNLFFLEENFRKEYDKNVEKFNNIKKIKDYLIWIKDLLNKKYPESLIKEKEKDLRVTFRVFLFFILSDFIKSFKGTNLKEFNNTILSYDAIKDMIDEKEMNVNEVLKYISKFNEKVDKVLDDEDKLIKEEIKKMDDMKKKLKKTKDDDSKISNKLNKMSKKAWENASEEQRAQFKENTKSNALTIVYSNKFLKEILNYLKQKINNISKKNISDSDKKDLITKEINSLNNFFNDLKNGKIEDSENKEIKINVFKTKGYTILSKFLKSFLENVSKTENTSGSDSKTENTSGSDSKTENTSGSDSKTENINDKIDKFNKDIEKFYEDIKNSFGKKELETLENFPPYLSKDELRDIFSKAEDMIKNDKFLQEIKKTLEQ
jgi:hypothetical protein